MFGFIITIVIIGWLIYTFWPVIEIVLDIGKDISDSAERADREAKKQYEEKMNKIYKDFVPMQKEIDTLKYNGYIPKWLYKEALEFITKNGYSFSDAENFMKRVLDGKNIKIDENYSVYHVPTISEKSKHSDAVSKCMNEIISLGFSEEKLKIFWMKCNPNADEREATLAVFAFRHSFNDNGFEDF